MRPTAIRLVWALLWVAAGLTVFYMFRQVYMTFFGEFRRTHEQEHHLHESPPSMSYVLVLLGVLSLVGGFVHAAGIHRAVPARSSNFSVRSLFCRRLCAYPRVKCHGHVD